MPTSTANMMTTQRLPHPINNVLVTDFLLRMMGAMPHGMFAQKKNIGANQGDRVTWMRMDNPTAQDTPVPEGTDPTPIMPTRTTLSAQLRQYKAVMKGTDWMDLTGLNAQAVQNTDWLGDCLAITYDKLYRNCLAGAASTVTCSHGDGTATLLNATDIDTAVTNLRTANARKLRKMIQAGPNVGTSPISPSYVAFAHEDLRRDLKAVAGFTEVKNYASPGDAYPDEFGATGEVRWILTTNGYYDGSTYYHCPVIGEQAYGGVTIEAGNHPLIYKSPEEAGSPTNAFWTYAFSVNLAVRILNDSFLCVIKATKSS